METIRAFKKMSLWDFINLMQKNCFLSGKVENYFLYLDELRMRKVESISEGGNFKLISLASELKAEFEKELVKKNDFASKKEVTDFNFTIEEIYR